jgi:hypothetical protein
MSSNWCRGFQCAPAYTQNRRKLSNFHLGKDAFIQLKLWSYIDPVALFCEFHELCLLAFFFWKLSQMKRLFRIEWDGVIRHAQEVMDNGVVIVSPYNFGHPSRLYYQLWKIAKYYCGLGSSGIVISVPSFMKIGSSISESLYCRNCRS